MRCVFCFPVCVWQVVFCGLCFASCGCVLWVAFPTLLLFFFVCSDASACTAFIAPPNKRDTGAPCSHLILTPADSAFQRGKTNPLVHCYSHNIGARNLAFCHRKILFLLFFLVRAVCAALLLAVARGARALAVARNK